MEATTLNAIRFTLHEIRLIQNKPNLPSRHTTYAIRHPKQKQTQFELRQNLTMNNQQQMNPFLQNKPNLEEKEHNPLARKDLRPHLHPFSGPDHPTNPKP
jgi:hypothetical protein